LTEPVVHDLQEMKGTSSIKEGSMRKIRRLLVANRSEITIRVFCAAAELGIRHDCHLCGRG
jgi:hypothetical protein